MHTDRRSLVLLLGASALSGCAAVGPGYQRPSAPLSPTFKEAEGWAPASPGDLLDKGDWWALFNDPVLSGLERRVAISNQNVIAAEAAYRQARALVEEQRASLFPTVDLNAGANASGGGSGSGGSNSSRYQVNIGASWEPDVWGRIRRTIEAAKANAQASQADLAAAALSAQGELAADYFALREADAEMALDQAAVDGYRRTVQITQNRYNAGIAPHSDVLQAQTQLDNALADLETLRQQRATYEHAIAVLAGEAPGNFSLPADTRWQATAPDVPPGVPATLLQRRPDIAAAERRVAAANAQIGIQRAAYFPTLSLTGQAGFASNELGSLFSASSFLWSLGANGVLTLLDFGARKARVEQARAAYDQAVAQYRQTVLTALQDVENQLVATRVLARQEALRRDASAAADQAEAMVFNRYQAGQVSYVEVVTAQTSAYSARRALLQTRSQRLATAVALIQSLGGGWHGPTPG